jgi:hypothetical protein
MKEEPSWLKSRGKRLDTNFDETDLVRPMIVLTQGLSPQAADGSCPSGEFWHTGAMESLGDEFYFTVAAARKKYILFAPRGDSDGRVVLARSEDAVNWDKPNTKFEVKLKNSKKKVVWNTGKSVASSGLAEFGSSDPDDPDSTPAATLIYEFLVFLPDRPELGAAVMSVSRTKLAKGKKLVTLVETRSRASDIFACNFLARAISDNRNDDNFHNVEFSSAGFVDNEEFRDMVAQSAERMKTFRGAEEGYEAEQAGEAGKGGGAAARRKPVAADADGSY